MARAAARLRAQLPHAGRAESRTAPRCRHRHQPSAGHLAGRGRGGGGAGRGAIFSADTALTPDTTTWPGPGACLVRPRQVRGQTRGHKAARRQVAGGRWLGCGGQWLVCWPRLGWTHCYCRQSCPAPAPSVCDHLVSGGDLARLQAAPRQQGGHHEYRISNRTTETPIQYFVCFH